MSNKKLIPLAQNELNSKETLFLTLENNKKSNKISFLNQKLLSLQESNNIKDEKIKLLETKINIQSNKSDMFNIIKNELDKLKEELIKKEREYIEMINKERSDRENEILILNKENENLRKKIEISEGKLEVVYKIEEEMNEKEKINEKLNTEIIQIKKEYEAKLKSVEIDFILKYDKLKNLMRQDLSLNIKNSNLLSEEHINTDFKLMLIQNQKFQMENIYLEEQIKKLLEEKEFLKKKIEKMKINTDFNLIHREINKQNNNKSKDTNKNELNDNEINCAKEEFDGKSKYKEVIKKDISPNTKDINKNEFNLKIKENENFYLKSKVYSLEQCNASHNEKYKNLKTKFESYITQFSFIINKIEIYLRNFNMNENNLETENKIQTNEMSSFQKLFSTLDIFNKNKIIEDIIILLLPLCNKNNMITPLKSNRNYYLKTTASSEIPFSQKKVLVHDVKEIIKSKCILFPNKKVKLEDNHRSFKILI